jgi:secondary thiamine-phosphate synthase enzyme
MLKEFEIQTNENQEIIGITEKVKEIILDSGIESGICVVYVPHATAGIIINENNDPSVSEDILKQLNEIIPKNNHYKHDKIDNNSHSHIKSSIIGPSETIIIENNKLILGTWQEIALVDFDGPKNRKICVKLTKD